MPYRTIPTTDTRYFMIVTDKNGAEQDNDPDAPNGKSERVDAVIPGGERHYRRVHSLPRLASG